MLHILQRKECVELFFAAGSCRMTLLFMFSLLSL